MIRSLLVLLTLCAGCDSYLKANEACIEKASTRAQADACRAKLRDAGSVVEGGAHG